MPGRAEIGHFCCNLHTCLLQTFTLAINFNRHVMRLTWKSVNRDDIATHTDGHAVILKGGGHNGHAVVDRCGGKLPAAHRLCVVDASGTVVQQSIRWPGLVSGHRVSAASACDYDAAVTRDGALRVGDTFLDGAAVSVLIA